MSALGGFFIMLGLIGLGHDIYVSVNNLAEKLSNLSSNHRELADNLKRWKS